MPIFSLLGFFKFFFGQCIFAFGINLYVCTPLWRVNRGSQSCGVMFAILGLGTFIDTRLHA